MIGVIKYNKNSFAREKVGGINGDKCKDEKIVENPRGSNAILQTELVSVD